MWARRVAPSCQSCHQGALRPFDLGVQRVAVPSVRRARSLHLRRRLPTFWKLRRQKPRFFGPAAGTVWRNAPLQCRRLMRLLSV